MQFFLLVDVNQAACDSDVYGTLYAKIGREIEPRASCLIGKQNDSQLFVTRWYAWDFASSEFPTRIAGFLHSAEGMTSFFWIGTHSIPKRYRIDGNARAVILNVELPNKFSSPIGPNVLPLNLDRRASNETNPGAIGKTKLFFGYLVGVHHGEPHEECNQGIESSHTERSPLKIISALLKVGLLPFAAWVL